MRRTKNQKGYTIMELMIVIVIIGILIAIAVPAYNSFRARAQERACQSNMRVLKAAAVMYFADNDTDATSTANLVPYLDNAEGITCPSDDSAYEVVGTAITCDNHGTL